MTALSVAITSFYTTISIRLRPSVLDDIGLLAALQKLKEEWQFQYKIPLDLMIRCGTDPVPAEVETAIYRIIQEAITNITRHAGASTVSVLVEHRRNHLLAVIEDNGRGFDANRKMGNGHLGLVGMRERAELLDGKLTVESSIKAGTSVYIDIPLKVTAS